MSNYGTPRMHRVCRKAHLLCLALALDIYNLAGHQALRANSLANLADDLPGTARLGSLYGCSQRASPVQQRLC